MRKVCSGPDWQVSSSELGQQVAGEFRAVAKQHGSTAVWLPVTGVLVCSKRLEPAGGYPYEAWRDAILRTHGVTPK